MPALASHVHLAVLGEDVVLLDTRSDAYLCIPDGRTHLRPQPDGVRLDPTREAAAALERSGFLADADIPLKRARPTRPCRNLEGEMAGSQALGDVWRLGAAVADLLRRYHRRDLEEIVRFAQGSQPLDASKDADPELQRLAQVFQRLAPWLPIPRKCLARSFVLLRFLQRSGRRAEWVFGVTTWPFSAHCWIQVGDQVLDDHWERLLVYAPIMSVS